LQRAFPLDIPMVPSSMITIATDGEHLTYDGFSLSETIQLGNFKFIADYFGCLSLSTRRGDSAAVFMGSTCSGTPSPWWAIIEVFAGEFLMASSREGDSASPLPGLTAQMLCPLSSHPHHGWRMLWPRRWFHRGRQCHGQIPASLSSNTTHIRGGAVSASPCSATHH
jgi:hypothetical protein